MAKVTKTTDNKLWKNMGKEDPYLLLVRLQTHPASMEISMTNFQTDKNKPTISPSSTTP